MGNKASRNERPSGLNNPNPLLPGGVEDVLWRKTRESKVLQREKDAVGCEDAGKPGTIKLSILMPSEKIITSYAAAGDTVADIGNVYPYRVCAVNTPKGPFGFV